MSKEVKYVVVATDKDKRGVFAGYLETWDPVTKVAIMRNVQMVVYWSPETRGVVGLAATGPADGSRVTKAAKRGEIHGVEAIFECTPAAQESLEAAPWS